MKYTFIKGHRGEYKVSTMCRVLAVSPSGFYDWLGRPESHRAQEDRRLTDKILSFHQASRRTYGSPRIFKDLCESGETCGENRVARLMQRSDIKAKTARRFVVTTDSRQTTQPAPDHLKRDFTAACPNEAWVSDTTFISTREGWLFLAVVMDLFSRQVIGWSMGRRNDTQLVSDALTMALWRRGQLKNVIVHSDQGSTYASSAYQKQLKDNHLICSMSRKGECLDNAVAESFFGTLKTELVDDEDYRSRAEARHSLFEYIEVFYNRKRRHSSAAYLPPAEFERRYAA